jgi:hypothetical protein
MTVHTRSVLHNNVHTAVLIVGAAVAVHALALLCVRSQFNLFVFKLEEQEFKSEGDLPTSTTCSFVHFFYRNTMST